MCNRWMVLSGSLFLYSEDHLVWLCLYVQHKLKVNSDMFILLKLQIKQAEKYMTHKHPTQTLYRTQAYYTEQHMTHKHTTQTLYRTQAYYIEQNTTQKRPTLRSILVYSAGADRGDGIRIGHKKALKDHLILSALRLCRRAKRWCIRHYACGHNEK